MRILLIYPSYNFGKRPSAGTRTETTTPPLGLLYIAAVLQQHGYKVHVLDMNCEEIHTKFQLAPHLRKYRPDFIGLSTLSRSFTNIVDIATTCKVELPGVPLAIGGYFATINHNRILSNYERIDFVVRGEGEETVTELVRELEKSNPCFASIRGLSYRKDGHILINEERPLLPNLDDLPFPAYELIADYNYGVVSGLRTSKNLNGLLTTRGCHYQCKYCVCSAFSHSTIRVRRPENVVEELKYFYDKYGVREYIFVDDAFTFNKRRVLKICRLIREHNLDLEWHCEGRVDHADERMFRNMVNAGCRTIYFGIESGVNRILQYYRKNITFSMSQDAVRKARNARLNIIGSFMIGAPIETLTEMRETIRKATTLDIDFAQFHPLLITRGTPLWTELVHQGLIIEERRWLEPFINSFEIHPEVTIKDLPRLMKEFNNAFYLRKSYIQKQIVRTLLYRKKTILLNLHLLPRIFTELKNTLYL